MSDSIPMSMTERTVLPVADPAEVPAGDLKPEEISLPVRLVILTAILAPLLGVLAAPFFVWGWGFHWTDLILLISTYVLTALGITVGFHRLFVHRSFETSMVVKAVFAVLGSMAVEGPLFHWVAQHRRHHQHSDTEADPHSPHHQTHDGGVLGALRSFWFAHIGWFFKPDPTDLSPYVKDLAQSPTLRWISALFPLWAALSFAIPAVLGGLITKTWAGAVTGLIWGGLVRVFLVHHVTWSVNSACHLWGLRPYQSNDESRNNAVFGVLAMGEGWHNTHHAFPTSPRHGLGWWQIDMSYWVIWTLARLGLAWNLKLPTKEARLQRRRTF
jgi:stearoyl-CoA desaturase (delta-9 desaturase)